MARTRPPLAPHPHVTWPLAFPVLGAVAVLAAGCGGGSATTPAGSTSTRTGGGSAAPGASPVLVTSTPLGRVLTDRSGRTLYLLTSDSATSTTCTGACLSAWPPVAAPSGSPSAPGVSGSLGSFTRPGGSAQLTVAGHPLYTYAGDAGPGQTNGEGIASFGGTWWAVAPDGSPAQHAAPSGQSSSAGSSGSSGSSGSGYGY